MWTENRFPEGYRYDLPVSLSAYVHQFEALLSNPPGPGLLELSQNGVGVPSLPVEERTQIGVFELKRR
jgi:hypothetical protein